MMPVNGVRKSWPMETRTASRIASRCWRASIVTRCKAAPVRLRAWRTRSRISIGTGDAPDPSQSCATIGVGRLQLASIMSRPLPSLLCCAQPLPCAPRPIGPPQRPAETAPPADPDQESGACCRSSPRSCRSRKTARSPQCRTDVNLSVRVDSRTAESDSASARIACAFRRAVT